MKSILTKAILLWTAQSSVKAGSSANNDFSHINNHTQILDMAKEITLPELVQTLE